MMIRQINSRRAKFHRRLLNLPLIKDRKTSYTHSVEREWMAPRFRTGLAFGICPKANYSALPGIAL